MSAFVASIHQMIRGALDAFAPDLAGLYRLSREAKAVSQPALQTPYGFRLAGPSHLAEGSFEKIEIELFIRCLNKCKDCVDVGANVGLYSCIAASLGRRVIAIEPLPLNKQFLLRNLFDNGFLETEVHLEAVSDAIGLTHLYGGGTAASLVRGWAGEHNSRGSIVPSTTLDTILGERFPGIPLMIKIDVEGHEYAALKGAEAVMKRVPSPVWLVEISLLEHWPEGMNPNFLRTFEMFWSHDYLAFTADSEERAVLPSDVNRWLAEGRRGFGSHNYLFKSRRD